uniref:Uncharacterized protein n=1 Tax=Trypanosoma vivax (strain Y486) TaxID=1055687 RepID=G0U0E9_TRYVY|nr:hypothetical protein, unlikely [Trypanosoma vivax Y486]
MENITAPPSRSEVPTQRKESRYSYLGNVVPSHAGVMNIPFLFSSSPSSLSSFCFYSAFLSFFLSFFYDYFPLQQFSFASACTHARMYTHTHTHTHAYTTVSKRKNENRPV